MFNLETQNQKALQLLSLHQQETPLILPNVWEPLGAALLEDLDYPMVATSSSAVALTNGQLDGEKISFEEHLSVLKKIAAAVSVPVTADIEKGYADTDEQLVANTEALIGAGIVGINFEDTNKHSGGLVAMDEQCRKIRLIRETADRKGVRLFINARVDTYIHRSLFAGSEEQLQETIRRGKAYAEAGADCLFPILIKEEQAIKTLVDELPIPLNVMQFPGIPSYETLSALGVKRISLGSSLLKVAIQAMKQEALLLKDLKGQEAIINNEITSDYLEGLIQKA